jgi:hypothetical protein
VIAAANSPSQFLPAWGAVVLVALGAAYLVLGSRWPRLFDTFSMTVLGCGVGLLGSVWVPWPQWAVVTAGGIVLGGLTAFFRPVAHGVLVAVVLGMTLASLAGLLARPDGFASYLVVDLPERTYSVQVRGPNLAEDPVLAAWLTGLLAGGAIALLRLRFSQWLATSAQGAGLIVFAFAQLAMRRLPQFVQTHPLTLAAAWLCLTVIGIAVQRAIGLGSPPPPVDGRPPREPEFRKRRRPDVPEA